MKAHNLRPMARKNKPSLKSSDDGEFSSTQVLHSDRQITNIDEVEFGVKYRLNGYSGPEYVTFESQYTDDKGITWMLTKNGVCFSVRDMGLVPYSDGKWNSVGWLEELD